MFFKYKIKKDTLKHKVNIGLVKFQVHTLCTIIHLLR